MSLPLYDQSNAGAGTRAPDSGEATPEQIAAWLESYAGERDPRLRERIILAHLGLADRLAMRYRDRPSTTPDDLRQIARIGLIAAVDRYDPDRGTPFAPFAIATILGQLKRYLRDSTWQVGVPRTVKDNALRLAAALDGFPRSFDGWPRADRMAGEVDLDEEEIRQAVMAMENRTVLSLDVPVEQGAPPLGQLLPDTGERTEVEDLIMLPKLVSSLPAVERAVVVLYYFNGLKQREIGALIGCSQMQVSRLLRRSCERLHDALPISPSAFAGTFGSSIVRAQRREGPLMAKYDPQTALIVVDIQNDFADPGGSLYVRGGEEVVPVVNREIELAAAAGATVVYTQDWHPESTPHFAKDGGIWPVHCVQGTWGAEFHPELHVEGEVGRKGSGGEEG